MNQKITYQDTQYFSKLVSDYLNEVENIKPFINYFPKLENFAKQIVEKQKHNVERSILVEVLRTQNNNLALSKSSKGNIDSLKLDTSFTVTTGHQLCLFTGPSLFYL